MSPPGQPPAPDPDTIVVNRLPTCEYCLDRSEYVGETKFGARRVFMCARHFRQHGRGLGQGRSQRLRLAQDDAGRS